jgi:hypothetical protein
MSRPSLRDYRCSGSCRGRLRVLNVKVSLRVDMLRPHLPPGRSIEHTLSGCSWSLILPLTVPTDNFAMAASLRKRVKNTFKSDRLTNLCKYTATPSLFFRVARGTCQLFIYDADAFCSSKSLLRGVVPFDMGFEVCPEAARGELKYVVGATGLHVFVQGSRQRKLYV